MREQKKVIIVAGPTASGKTDRAFELARKFHTSIISADSRQCYSELNIGVAKPPAKILSEIPHYFINSHSIHEEVNVNTFETYALDAATKVFDRYDTVIMAGGTGLYIRAFTEGLDEIPRSDKEIESQVRKHFQENGISWIEAQLNEKDHLFSEKGEMKNPQRMMRALAVKLSTGKSILEFHSSTKIQRPFLIRKIYIDIPREVLYQRINQRVDAMMESGLLDEARKLFPFKHLNAFQTVGYSELFDFFEDKFSLKKAIELIKRNTRHYAKRQETWFKKYFVDADTEVVR